MKRVIGILTMAGVLLFAVGAQGRLSKLANGTDGYHHLLMLDQREAAEHLKALHFYAQQSDNALDPAIVSRHVDELGRNLTGMREEISRLEQVTLSGVSVAPQLADVRLNQERAAALVENLKAAAEQPSPRPEQIRSISFDAYQYLRTASAEHGRVMSKLGVREPMQPSR
jgi:hypothetical protein